MSYSILRVEKVKNANVTRALQRHNQRENKTYGNQDIDLTKTHLNYDLINAEKVEYEKEIERRIEEGYQGKRKIRSDAIKHVDGIITSDKAFFDKLTPERQKQFFEDSLEFVKQEYGEKNIIYATVHLDEKTPHMHFGFVPLTEDGRLSAKDVLGNKVAMSKLQDRFNDFINEKGYNLERGEKATGREHIEIMKFKEKTLNEKVSGLETEVNKLQQNVEKIRNIDERIKEVDNFDNKTKRILNQVTMNKADYEAFKSVAKSGIATLHKFEDLKKTSTETFQELNQKNQELEKNQNYYMDRTHQLLQENRALKQENIELKQENKSLKREIERFKEYTRNTLLNIQYGMKKLSEKLKDSELYKVFKDKIFSPSIEIAKEKYHEDLQQEKKELASEKDKEMEM